MIVRSYEPGDWRGLQEAIDSVCAEQVMATPRFQPTPAWQHALVDARCRCHLLLVAVAEGRVVGWCRLFPERCADGIDSVELGIGVLRDWRGQGIGTALLDWALAWAAERRLGCVLTTRADNEPALRLFRAAGFRTQSGKNGTLEMVLSAPRRFSKQGVGV